jgi:hypothetical protein
VLKRQRLGVTLSRALRVILGAILSLGILSANIPASAVASAPMCTLPCCAGRAPHAAGSCMNGSCHAFLKGRVRSAHVHRQLPLQQPEQLCGPLPSIARATAKSLRKSPTLTVGDSSEQSGTSRSHEAASLSTSNIGKPCQPDCGTGIFSSSSQSRSRDTGAISHADKPRPPTITQADHSSLNCAMALDTLCRRSRPRGPPISPS